MTAMTPWYRFGVGFQRTLREPYLDAEVMPRPDGTWVWQLSELERKIIAQGESLSAVEAKAEATARLMEQQAMAAQAPQVVP